MQFTEGKHILAFSSAEQSECQCSVLLQPLVYVYLDPPCRGRQSEKDSEPLGAAARPSAALPGVRVAAGNEAQGSGNASQEATGLAAALRRLLLSSLLNRLCRRCVLGHVGLLVRWAAAASRARSKRVSGVAVAGGTAAL
jgi:hypothetical protein